MARAKRKPPVSVVRIWSRRYKMGKRLGSLYPLLMLKHTRLGWRYVCVGFITGKDNARHILDDLG